MTDRLVTILGSTGSIGESTLEVLALHRDHYKVYALTAYSSLQRLAEQCIEWQPSVAVVPDEKAAATLAEYLKPHPLNLRIAIGEHALAMVAAEESVDTVVAAIVGAAGLLPTLAAANSGKKLLLANKEALVMSGDLLMKTAAQSGATVVPLDSEHNAMFQSLPGNCIGDAFGNTGVVKLHLTGSGGPFRGYSQEALSSVTLEQALVHPNWSMGPKITVDSATLMNKGLEVIEACHLFGATGDQIEVIIHPQSIVHSLISYADGSVLAQMGNPDMRTPIAHALAWPERMGSGVKPLDLVSLAKLEFEAPDWDNFPCLQLAFDAFAEGGTACTILNAANEVAVEAFLKEKIGFTAIPEVVINTRAGVLTETADDLETILNADATARQFAHTIVHRLIN